MRGELLVDRLTGYLGTGTNLYGFRVNQLENIVLAPIAIRLRIVSGSRVCLPFVNRSGNEASRKKMEQKHDHETAGKSEHEPSHVCVWIKQGVEHEYPKGSREHRDSDRDEHCSRETREIPRKLVVHGPTSPPGRVDFYGQPLCKGQLRFLRATPVA